MEPGTPLTGRRNTKQPSGRVPFVPWSSLSAHLAQTWLPGQHVSLIGKTGSGKSHLGLEILEMRPYVIIAATKRRDTLIDKVTPHYKTIETMGEIPVTETGRPVYRRVIVWPGQGIKDERVRLQVQKAVMADTLATAERQGHWTVQIDDVMWFYDRLQLKSELDSIWYEARSSGVSLVAAAQRPTKVPRLMISQASHLFLWYVSDKRDLEPLREIAGVVPRELIESELPSLSWDRHEFLYVAADTGYVARSIAPPR